MLIGPRLLESLYKVFAVVWQDGNGQINVACPYCHKRGMSQDTSGHLGLNVEKDAAHCVRCDWGRYGLRSWLRDFGITGLGSTFKEAKSSLAELKKRLVMKESQFDWKPAQIPKNVQFLTEEHWELEGFPHTESLKEKRISCEEMLRHQLCLQTSGRYANYVIFPHFEDEEVVYWQGRATSSAASLRKVNPPPETAPFGRSYWVYGMELIEKGAKVGIVEGTLDTISATSWMMKQYGSGNGALGLNGTAMSFPDGDVHLLNTQFGKLISLEPSEVLVMFDADALKKGEALAKILQSCGLNARAVTVLSKDPNEATQSELTEMATSSKLNILKARIRSIK